MATGGKSRQTPSNPLLNEFLKGSAFDFVDKADRAMYIAEGLMRFKNGQISAQEMASHGTLVMPLKLNTMLPFGSIISLDADDNTSKHDPALVGREDKQNKKSFIGPAPRVNSNGQTLSVRNREAIDPKAMYMWKLGTNHKKRSVCDDLNGRVFKGNEVPEPPTRDCNCTLKVVKSDNDKQDNAKDGNIASVGLVGQVYKGIQVTDRALKLMGMNENAVWRDTLNFFESVNQANTKLVQAIGYLQDPSKLVDEISSDIVGRIKNEAASHFKSKAQELVLSQLKDPALKRAANLYATSNNSSLSQDVSPQLSQGIRAVRIANSISKADNLDNLANILKRVAPLAKELGLDKQLGSIAGKATSVVANKASVVLLEDGLRGLARMAMYIR